jgi:hypothetical protein
LIAETDTESDGSKPPVGPRGTNPSQYKMARHEIKVDNIIFEKKSNIDSTRTVVTE